MGTELTVAGLFSGIGGIELGLHAAGHRSVYMCEYWEPARAVLSKRFPSVELAGDILDVKQLPAADVTVGGFPCTDLSQAGRTAGISGDQSGLVMKALQLVSKSSCEWLVLENVRNMLHLHRGKAMEAITSELEQMGFRWAYRLVDSRFTGVPQRRQRVILVASREHDPRTVLFADDAGERPEEELADDAFGFYWTEGLRGLGWAEDAVPTLKGGSTLGIPSPPAVWLPGAPEDSRFVIPGITTGERMQGFDADWTDAPFDGRRSVGARWKMVGNAVTVGVAQWIGRRLALPGEWDESLQHVAERGTWAPAAWGENGKVWSVDVSLWPERHPVRHLSELMGDDHKPLSHKAASGFLSRLERGRLRTPEDFRLDLKRYVKLSAAA